MTPDESHFINTQIERIDKVVKRGFLAGETNDEIASNLRCRASNAAIRDSKAIARTAVMDMSHRAHYREWDANSDRIVMWEFDATMDYRVCERCYPLDGKRARASSALIANIQSSCSSELQVQHLAVNQNRVGLGKGGYGRRDGASIVEVNKRKSDARGRVYKTPARVKVNGKTVKMTKSSRDIKAREGKRVTMGDFIAQTTPDTRRQVLGVVRAKEFEYLVNDNRGPKLKDVDEVLRKVTLADADQLRKAQRVRSRRKKD